MKPTCFNTVHDYFVNKTSHFVTAPTVTLLPQSSTHHINM